MMDQKLDKLSYDIFSILESNFLFSSNHEYPLSHNPASGKVRILSIDAASDGGVLAALSLSRLEALLSKHSGDPSASISDFFDLAAGSGAGGLLAAMLFTRGHHGRNLFTADQALRFLITCSHDKRMKRSQSGIFRRIFNRSNHDHDRNLKKMFADATLRDTIKPLLVSCFDLLTGSPFMFSRSDAVESDAFDFLIRDVIAAAECAGRSSGLKSVDGKTQIKAIGGGLAMGNPTAAAITHVLNNRREFPFADGVEDLLVVSIGSSADVGAGLSRSPASIAGDGAADAVDQSVAAAFGERSSRNYVRIQANRGLSVWDTKEDRPSLVSVAESVLLQRNVESVMFRGKKVSAQSNGEKIEWVSNELAKEQDRRNKGSVPTVFIKPALATPRTSSATTVTVTSTATSASL